MLLAVTVPVLEAGDGVKVAAPLVIASGDSPTGAVDRAGALATWRDHGCILLARLAADGSAGKPVQLGCGATGAPRATSSGEVTLIVWPASGELAGALVTPELHVTPIHTRGEHPVAVSAAFDGTRFLVTTASCTAADLLVFDRGGVAGARTVLHTAKAGEDIDIAGAAVGCEGGTCEVAYARANTTLGIDCDEMIRTPRWLEVHTAPLAAGVPGTFGALVEHAIVTRHGIPWAWGGYNVRTFAASGAHGMLTATTSYKSELWNGRETLTRDHVEVEYQPTDPNAPHHAPLVVPKETSPDVLALGGDRFILLTAARDGIVARAIAIEPTYFAHAPGPRPAILTGTVRTSAQKPAVEGAVTCPTRRGHCGAAAIGKDGTFELQPELPIDYRATASTEETPVLVYANDEYSFTPALHETRAVIQLTAAAHITGTISWPGGKPPVVKPMPVELEENGPHRGQPLGPVRDPLQLTFEAHGLLPVLAPYAMSAVMGMYSYGLHKDGTFDVPVIASGRAIVMVRSLNGEYGASALVSTAPGKTTHAELAMKKTSTLVIRLQGHKMAIDDDMRLAVNTFGCSDGGDGCIFDHIPAGPELVSFTTPDWTMARIIDVPPGTKKVVDLPFVPDLAPGDPGVHVARAIDGIMVTAVAPGGPAAGVLAPDDVITAIDGTPLTNDVATAIARLRGAPDSRVELTITRGRRMQKVTLQRSHGAAPP